MKYDKLYNKLMEEMSDEEVGQLMSGINTLVSGGVAQGETTGNALNIAQGNTTSTSGTNISKVSPEMQAKVKELMAKIPPDKLAAYQKNPEKFGAIDVSKIDLTKNLTGPT